MGFGKASCCWTMGTACTRFLTNRHPHCKRVNGKRWASGSSTVFLRDGAFWNAARKMAVLDGMNVEINRSKQRSGADI